MARVLIVYGTTEGHTAGIVGRMRDAIEAQGHVVAVERARIPPLAIPDDVDGVIVGASVHRTKHQNEVLEFAKRNRARLSELPSAFFQVCLTAADPSPDAAAETRVLIEEFSAWSGWSPGRAETFAGKLAWTQYDFFTRLLMRLAVRSQTSPQERDTSHDVDYTDYEAVRRFAEEFARSLGAR